MGCVFVKVISSGKKIDDTTTLPAEKEGRLGKKTESANMAIDHQNQVNLKIVSISNSLEVESVNAGWPTWLALGAGEAIKGWVPRKATSFQKLDKISQGTYNNVFKARDLETGRIVALKRVHFASTAPESVRFVAREIIVLRSLDHINVIKLEASSSIKFSEPQVKCYMQQLLRGLEHCHSRGVLHRDIKSSNLLIDNNGILKLAEFGLATFFSPSDRHPSTNRVVTLWYRPPELLLGCTMYDVGVDLWSIGCILGEMLSGKPIIPGRTEVEQLHKIFKLCGLPSLDYWQRSRYPRAAIFKSSHHYNRHIKDTFKGASSSTLTLLDTLLAIEPENRGTSSSALVSEFFTTEPYACHPSSLPKYPPTKKHDVKCRDEEAKRQGVSKRQEFKSMRLEKYHEKQNNKRSNTKYILQDEGLPAFPHNLTRNRTVQYGSSWRRKMSMDDVGNVSFRSMNDGKVSNATWLKKERPCVHRTNDSHSSGSTELSCSVKYRTNSQRYEQGLAYNQSGDG